MFTKGDSQPLIDTKLQSCPYPIYVDPLEPLSLFDGCSIQNRGEAKVAEDFEA